MEACKMAASVLPEWVQWLGALSVPAIAAVGVWIAWQQRNIARRQADTAAGQMDIARGKLKHELFDRRFKVFEAARKFLAIMLAQAHTTREQERDFLLSTGEAQFLFDDDIHAYFEEWRAKASAIRKIDLALENLDGEERRKPLVDQKGEINDYFEHQYEELINKFRHYLTLRHE